LELRFVVVEAAAEAEETEDAERQRQRQCIARVFLDMCFEAAQRSGSVCIDGKRDGLDMGALARGEAVNKGARLRRRRPCLDAARLHLKQPSAGDMGEGEVRVGRKGAIE
jgi:hypothetical protein